MADDEKMTKKEMMDAIGEAVDAGMHKYRDGVKDGAVDASAMDAMKKAFMDALGPVLDGMKKMNDVADERQRAEDAAKAETAAREAGEKLVKETEDRMRQHFTVFVDAMPLLPQDKLAELAGADTKAVLIAALGDAVPEPEKQSVEYLHGALAIAMNQRKQLLKTGIPSDDLPPGVRAFDSRNGGSGNVRSQSMDAFVKAQTERYQKSGGV